MAARFTIPQLTKKQRQIAAAAVICVGAFGTVYFRYFWKPISTQIAATAAKIEELETNITRAESQAARLPRVEKELELLNQQAAEAERRLPKNKDVPAVIETVSRLARSYHVDLVSLSPGSASQKQYFIEVPYSIGAVGSFHDIGRFFASIALEERIFNIRDVSYAKSGAAGELAVTFTLVSYQYKG